MSAGERLWLAIQALERVLLGLHTAAEHVQALAPLTEARLAALAPEEKFALDALLKRFENAQDIAARQVFRWTLAAAGEDIAEMLPIDIANRLEQVGALASALRWREFTLLRNRLTHTYPVDVMDQLDILNRTLQAAPHMEADLRLVLAWVRARGLAGGAA